MRADTYQNLALRTDAGNPRERRPQSVRLANAALGLAGESGEFAELVKKWLYHGRELDQDMAIKELGDVLWYVALAADALETTIAHIMERNIAKLAARYPQGFTTDAANAPREGEAA